MLLLIGIIYTNSVYANIKPSDNSRDNYIEVSLKYYMAEYEECGVMGDAIENPSNIYDAMILGYSALSHRKIAYGERKIDFKENVFIPNNFRANYKAEDAIDYLFNTSFDIPAYNLNVSLSDQLECYNIIIDCCKITKTNRYKIVLDNIHKDMYTQISDYSDLSLRQRLEIIYFEIEYQLSKKNYSIIDQKLLPEFEQYVQMTSTLNERERVAISIIYFRLSKLLNYYAVENSDEYPYLYSIAVDVLIHSKDYSIYARKSDVGSFKLNSWKSVQRFLSEGSLALLYFEYSRDLDSWNYIWSFDNKSTNPKILYGGHSYWSEAQSTESVLRDRNDITRFFIVGTSNMSQTDYSNDIRAIRLNTISELLTKDVGNSSGNNILVIGNLTYSKIKKTDFSSYKGFSHSTLGEFSSAVKEINVIKSAFNGKISIAQGDSVKKELFYRLNKEADIVHISTHGIFDRKKLTQLNEIDPEGGIVGNNIWYSCGLALSGYNDDRGKNFISAYDIKGLKMDNIDLVFLSACESGTGRSLLNGDYSLAEAFTLAGVGNIIAVIDPIDENVATNFAEHFYKKITSGFSFHDAFYQTKLKVCPNDRIIFIE